MTNTGNKHLAVLFISSGTGEQGYANLGVSIASEKPTMDEVRAIEQAARQQYSRPIAALINMIPLGGA